MKPLNFAVWLIATLIVVTLTLQSACAPPPPEVKRPNQAPVIESVNYAQDTMSNSEVQIECLAKDADSDTLTYKWTAEAGEIKGTFEDILQMKFDYDYTQSTTTKVKFLNMPEGNCAETAPAATTEEAPPAAPSGAGA